jgi:RNA polymerase sigma-70 factor (ECF subfamily)
MMSDRRDFSDRGSALSAGSTSTSLLAQVKARDPVAWTQLVELYGPLIYGWCRRAGIEAQDARDVVQEVLGSVATSIDDFRGPGPRGRFRAWLRTITRHRVADHFRRRAGSARAVGGSTALQQLQNVPEPADDSPAEIDAVWQRVLELVRAEFADRIWQAFWQTTVDDQRGADVAKSLGMSVDAVYQAKSRVLRRVREVLRDAEDDNA